jgi:outer membrane immunogenic protein
MRKVVVGIALSLLMTTAPVQAADIRVAVKARPVIPPFSWAGFYVGGHLGFARGHSDFDQTTDAIFPGFLVDTGTLILIPGRLGTVPATSADDTGLLGGAQAGHNWQVGRYVFGVEGDISGTRLREDVTVAAFTVPPGNEAGQTLTGTYSTKINWIASLRARLGMTWERLLIYVTGGAAFIDAEIESSFTLTNTNAGIVFPVPGATGTTFATASVHDVGWTLGGGLQWAVTDAWSLGAEYRHSYFGRHTIALASTDPSGQLQVPQLLTNVRLTVDQATLRANYRLGNP